MTLPMTPPLKVWIDTLTDTYDSEIPAEKLVMPRVHAGASIVYIYLYRHIHMLQVHARIGWHPHVLGFGIPAPKLVMIWVSQG